MGNYTLKQYSIGESLIYVLTDKRFIIYCNDIMIYSRTRSPSYVVRFSDDPTIIQYSDLNISLPNEKVKSFASILTNWSKHFDFTLEKHENREYSNVSEFL